MLGILAGTTILSHPSVGVRPLRGLGLDDMEHISITTGPDGQMQVSSGGSSLSPDEAVQQYQDAANAVLGPAGCPTIGRDGRLGPETCGAIRYLNSSGMASISLPAGCASIGSNYTCNRPGPAPIVSPQPEVTTTASTGGGSKNAMLIGGLLLAAGLGGYYLYSQSKKRGRR